MITGGIKIALSLLGSGTPPISILRCRDERSETGNSAARVRGRDPLLMNVSSGRFFWGLPLYLKEVAAFLVPWEIDSLSINARDRNYEKGTSRIHTSGERPFR